MIILMYNFDPYNVLLAIATDIPQRLLLCSRDTCLYNTYLSLTYLQTLPDTNNMPEFGHLQDACVCALINTRAGTHIVKIKVTCVCLQT